MFARKLFSVFGRREVPEGAVQGYVDEISAGWVKGWARDPAADRTLTMELLAGGVVLARGVADQTYLGLGDAQQCGFLLPRPDGVAPAALSVRIAGHGKILQRAAPYQGFVDQRSVFHVQGWVRDRFDPTARVRVEAVSAAGTILAAGVADKRDAALTAQKIGDGCHGFTLIFPQPVDEATRDGMLVRIAGSGEKIALSPRLGTNFDTLNCCVAMDIVNNCNLRCPFCLFDYSETRATKFMDEATYRAALRLLPIVNDGGFWLSCLHEPSMHPRFLEFLQMVPLQWRRKIMFSTNLAKRMPDEYFSALAESGVFRINISLESTDPVLYEKFRKGARWKIFAENWDRLVAAWGESKNPPRLHYIVLAYKTNFREIPRLVKLLRAQKHAANVEVRFTFHADHIPENFARAEYLDDADWAWLAQELSEYDPREVTVSPADQKADASEAGTLVAGEEIVVEEYPALPLHTEMEWDGRMVVWDKWDHPSGRRHVAAVNVKELDDPYGFLIERAGQKLPLLAQGFLDELSVSEAVGWVRDGEHPAARVAVEAVIAGPQPRVVARGLADRWYAPLERVNFGDGKYGFRLTFEPPLTPAERDRLEIRPVGAVMPLLRAPKYQGFVDELGPGGVAGWVRNRFDPQERVEYEVVLAQGSDERVLARGIADVLDPDLAADGVGDGVYGFRVVFDPPLQEQDWELVLVRPGAKMTPLALSPKLRDDSDWLRRIGADLRV